MGQGDFSLTNGEWEVYECLWEAAPLSLTQIARRLSERTGLARSTGETPAWSARGFCASSRAKGAGSIRP